MAKREDTIAYLTSNCDCWKGAKGKEALNVLTDEELDRLKTNAERTEALQLTANAFAEVAKVVQAPEDLAANEFPAFIKKKMKGKAKEDGEDDYEEDEEEDEMPMKKGKKTMNQATTLQEWEASMPAEARAVWNSAKKVEQAERVRLVRRLVANVADETKRKALGEKLFAKSIDELADLVEMLPVANHAEPAEREPLVNWLGAAAPAFAGNRAVDEDDDRDSVAAMTPPTLNFAEIAALPRRQAQ